MAFRFVRGAGNTVEPAVISVRGSGTIWPGSLVEFSRTGGAGVTPGSETSTTTNIFGIALDYIQGASDTDLRVIPFVSGQIWEGDCANVVTTAQIGIRHALSALAAQRGRIVHNTGTDFGAGNIFTAVFDAVAMVGPTAGSAKLLGRFRVNALAVPEATATADFV